MAALSVKEEELDLGVNCDEVDIAPVPCGG
jgi:hypothetical protein